MNANIEDILKDVEALIEVHRNPGLKRSLLTRIQIACEALLGQSKEPDLGPWEVSEDGRRLYSDDFTHDVTLTVGGDFYGDEARVAYSKRLAQQLNGLPKEPPAGLLASMAMRYRHDFGLLTPEQQEPLLRDMRQLYEEVSGHGFYRWE